MNLSRPVFRHVLLHPLAPPVAALLICLAFSFLFYPHVSAGWSLSLDPDRYWEISRGIVEDAGLTLRDGSPLREAIDRGPVYPLLLVGLALVAGPSVLAVQAMNAVFAALAVAGMVWLGRRLLDNPQAGVVTGWLTALHPLLWWYAARVWVESLLTLTVVAVVITLLWLRKSPSIRRAAVCGALLGLAALTKAVMLPLILLAAGMLMVQKRAAACGMLVLVAGVLLSPWIVRTALVKERALPVHSTLGFNLLQGDALGENYLSSPGSFRPHWEEAARRAERILAGTGVAPFSPEGDAMLVSASIQENAAHPVGWARHVLVNAVTFWYLGEAPWKSAAIALLDVPLAIAVGWGIWRMRRRREEILAPAAVILLFAGVHALIVGWARYSAPIVPFCVLVVMWLWKDLRRGRKRKGAGREDAAPRGDVQG